MTLTVSRLAKSFGGVTAVRDLTFDVPPASLFGIIGPNGAGKTSLFNVLTGFLRADAGSVQFEGREVLGQEPYQLARLGMARSFQLVKPFIGMTALETLILPGCVRRPGMRVVNLHAAKARAHTLLESIGLEDRSEASAEDLTQGQLRLLDIARALATQPRLLLLDEPFSGLDQGAILTLSKLLRQHSSNGMAIVIIEHRLRELMPLVSNVMVLNFGAKLAEGKPTDVVRDRAVIEAYLGTRAKDLANAVD